MSNRAAALLLLCSSAVLAAQRPTRVSVTAAGLPLAEVLGQVARQAGLGLDLPEPLAQRTVTISFSRVPLDAALDQLARTTRLEFAVADGRLVVREPAPRAPEPEGIPAVLAQRGAELLGAALDTHTIADREAFARWLRSQRPDWRERLPRALDESVVGPQPEPEVAEAAARLWLACGQLRETERLARRLSVTAGFEATAWDLYAEVELQTGDAAAAAQRARRALDLQPDHPSAASTLVTAIFYAGSEGEALAEAYSALSRTADNAPLMAAIGDILRRQPDGAAEATTWIEKALALDPDSADARYTSAAIAAGMDEDTPEQWRECLAVEGSSLRAARARARASAVQSIALSDRGGTVWDVSRDGVRVLYADPFRKQLQITDSSGFGLAVQVTDQEATKTWASLSPSEEWLAWCVEGRQTQLFLQNAHLSGTHRMVAESPRGRTLRRTAWSPDGRYLLFTERGGTEPPRLRCWDMQADAESAPPPPLAGLEGLADVAWVDDQTIVGTVTRGRRHAPVVLRPDGSIFVLRPPATGGAPVPSLDPSLARVVYRPNGGQLVLASADGGIGGEVQLLAGSAGRDVEYGVWSPDGANFLTSLRAVYPVVLHLAGLETGHSLLVRGEPLLASGPEPTRYHFELASHLDHAVAADLAATLVKDDGADGWREATTVALPARGTASLDVAPPAAEPGEHWLRVEVTVDGVADEVRWYSYEIAPN